MNLYIPQSVSNIPKPAFGWGKSSGLLECDVKVADAENVPEKGVSNFYSYWNIFFSAMSAFCVSLVVLAANMFAAWESEKITVEGEAF